MTKSGTGSRLCAAVAVTLFVMTAFGCAALAQQAPASQPSWTGQIDWWIAFPNGRLWGRLDLAFDADGQGNLKGRMTGDDHVEAQTPCGPTTTQTPSKLSANLAGHYTPGRNAMSLQVADPQFEQGQFSMCAIAPGGGYQRLSGQRFGGGGPLGQPGLAQLLSSLTVRADGSVEASGEWPCCPGISDADHAASEAHAASHRMRLPTGQRICLLYRPPRRSFRTIDRFSDSRTAPCGRTLGVHRHDPLGERADVVSGSAAGGVDRVGAGQRNFLRAPDGLSAVASDWPAKGHAAAREDRCGARL